MQLPADPAPLFFFHLPHMLAEHADRMAEEYWRGADLVMEVVSGGEDDRRRDLETKVAEYARARIPEYWIASMAIVQYEGTSAMMKSLTARSPASSPARPESRPVPNSASKPVMANPGASDVKRAS